MWRSEFKQTLNQIPLTFTAQYFRVPRRKFSQRHRELLIREKYTERKQATCA